MTRADVLEEAKKCVCGKREQDYGSPENNFRLIADLWTTYLDIEPGLTPIDVSMMMALLKIARIRNGGGTGDSFVDLAGYAACGGEMLKPRSKTIPVKDLKKDEVSIGILQNIKPVTEDVYYGAPTAKGDK